METAEREVPPESAQALERQGLPPLAARVFAARGVSDRRQADPPLDDLEPAEFADIGTLADLVARAIADGDPICVVGDADADGFTAAALLVCALRDLGGTVDYRIPPRTRKKHGIVPAIVEEVAAAGVRLILTVDNGVDAFAAATRARQLGVRLCVTDHHQTSGDLPDASCVVDPLREDCPFPDEDISGVGVAFYAAGAIRHKVTGDPAPLEDALDLVAIGTVSDRLDHPNNRILVNHGMRRINAGKCRPGVRALFRQANRQDETKTIQDIVCRIKKTLDSAGRLDPLNPAMACLLAGTDTEAERHAETLEIFKKQQEEKQQAIRDKLEKRDLSGLSAIVLHDPDWPPGVSSFIATCLVKKCRVPSIALCPGDPGQVRGSVRTPGQMTARELAERIEAEAPGLLSRWGGGDDTIGLTLDEGRVDELRRVTLSVVQGLGPVKCVPVATDGSPAPDEITPEAAHWLCDVAWGNGFERPRFVGEFTKLDERADGDRRRLSVRLGDRTFVAFSSSSARLGDTFRALFRIVPGDTRTDPPRLVLEDPL